MSARYVSNSSVLLNAGLVNNGVTNSDKYLAIKITKEFDSVLKELKIGVD